MITFFRNITMCTVRNPKRHQPSGRQQGFTLIELMIAMVLGLIVITALFNVFAGTKRSTTFSDGLRTMQENGRYGIATLQAGLRLAGYSPGSSSEVPLDISAGSESSLVVRMIAKYDCNGIATAAVGGLAVNTYTFSDANSQITCRGNSATPVEMPLIDGVDGFRILYGMADDEDEPASRYVSYDASLDPSLVKSVRVAILVNSLQPIRSRRVEETHILFDQEIDKDDQFARNVFSTTILLRNGG